MRTADHRQQNADRRAMETSSRRAQGTRRHGQAIIFILMVLVILTFVVLGNFDLHKIVHARTQTQNAGDAAALAAARWQGITLNLIGDLNIMQAVALASGDTDAAAAITNMQTRLAFTGPMVALMAAQQAAKNNGIFVEDDFTSFLAEHANRVRDDYPSTTGGDGEMLFPEPWPNAWEDYADMISVVAEQGVACAPDNMRLYSDPDAGSHILLDVDFYNSVAGRQWCWFYHHAPDLLEDYDNFFPCWWPALPDIPNPPVHNSEIYGLNLSPRRATLSGFLDQEVLAAVAYERATNTLPDNVMEQSASWFCFSDGGWAPWDAFDTSGANGFPAIGTVRPQYDYTGADAATRVVVHVERATPGPGGSTQGNTVTWTSAAKPFGSIDDSVPPHTYGLVLPAFRDVRLIPLDTSSSPASGGYNLDWRRHVEVHLPEYIEDGPSAGGGGCFYCQQLVTWESPAFRRSGVDWLAVNSYRCELDPAPGGPGGGGGGGGGGGTRRGH